MSRLSLKRGAVAEQRACALAEASGLTIRARNYRTKLGEIDIIAEDKRTIVFIEVRLRRRGKFGSAGESITVNKQRRIIRAAQWFLQREPVDPAQDCRFDAMCLNDDDDSIEWIKNAFSDGTGW
ncbi:MAG TPA: YraN family protein [Porticoccaceae bacterium]|jgi:putative endonuclease|nr:YraN family protein [Porticoccaceae bacterium]